MSGFTFDERILDFAIEEEETAYELYKKTAESLNNQLSPVLMDMANMEKGHARKLKAFKAGKSQDIGTTEVEDLKISDYLVDVKIDESSTLEDIVIFAIKSEEKAVLLYKELHRLYSDVDEDGLFLKLANEELKHKNDLEKYYDSEGFNEN